MISRAAAVGGGGGRGRDGRLSGKPSDQSRTTKVKHFRHTDLHTNNEDSFKHVELEMCGQGICGVKFFVLDSLQWLVVWLGP